MAVTPATSASVDKMPQPPSYLAPEAEEVWRVVVASRGGDLIAPEAYPVLVEFCRAVAQATTLGRLVDDFDPRWARDAEGLERWDRLQKMHDRAARRMAALATKLRLPPSSRVQAISAGRNADKGPKCKPWEFTGREDHD